MPRWGSPVRIRFPAFLRRWPGRFRARSGLARENSTVRVGGSAKGRCAGLMGTGGQSGESPAPRVRGGERRSVSPGSYRSRLSAPSLTPGEIRSLPASPFRRRGQVVRQRTANPLSPVRIRAAPLGFSGFSTPLWAQNWAQTGPIRPGRAFVTPGPRAPRKTGSRGLGPPGAGTIP